MPSPIGHHPFISLRRRLPLLLLAALALALGARTTTGRAVPAAAQSPPPTVTQACLTTGQQAPSSCTSAAGSSLNVPQGYTLQINGTGFSTTSQTTFLFTQSGSSTTYPLTTLACPSPTTCYAAWPTTPVDPGTTQAFTLVAQVNGVTGTAGTPVTVYGAPVLSMEAPPIANAFSHDQIAFIFCCNPTGGYPVTVFFGETEAQSVSCPNDYTCLATLSGSAFSGYRGVTFTALGGTSTTGQIYIDPEGISILTVAGQVLIDGAPAPQDTQITPYTVGNNGVQYDCFTIQRIGPGGYYAIPMYGSASCLPGSGTVAVEIYYQVNGQTATTSQAVMWGPPGGGEMLYPVNLSVSSSAAPPPPAPAPTPTPAPAQPMTITGRVQRILPPIVSENQIAQGISPVGGATVEALVGSTVCGTALTDRDGRFQLTVAAHPATNGCGRPGTTITLRVNGAGTGDPLPFQSGGSATVELQLPGPQPPPTRWP